MPEGRKRAADIAFLLALMAYIVAGAAFVPFHADEFMQMSMARDVFYMAHGQWDRIAFAPPVQPDTEQFLRLINGVVNKTLIAVAWRLDDRGVNSLPGIYAWSMPFDWNQRQHNVPNEVGLHVARWPSALLTALGVIPAFLIGLQLRRRSLAYPTAIMYTLHPVVLLNGRRAMMEGSLMFFTLLTVAWLLAMIVAEHSATARGFMLRLPYGVRYALLGLFAGLTIAAKQTGVMVAAAALIAALLAGLARGRSWRPVAWVALAALVTSLTWFALNPAYWNNPLGAMEATVAARANLLASQENGAQTYTSPWERLRAIVVQPFLTPPQFFESDTWSGLIDKQIAAYQGSTIDGWDWGPIIGWALTLLAGLGLLSLIRDALRRDLIAWAILIWTTITVLISLAIPLAWQRYYLPLLLVAIVLAATGLGRLAVRQVPEEADNRVPAVSDAVIS